MRGDEKINELSRPSNEGIKLLAMLFYSSTDYLYVSIPIWARGTPYLPSGKEKGEPLSTEAADVTRFLEAGAKPKQVVSWQRFFRSLGSPAHA